MARLTLVAVVTLGILGAFGSTARAASDTITLGLPERLLPRTPVERAELDALTTRLVRALPCSAPSCSDRPVLQVNIALGTDYEILDWFGKGLLDMAVVPDISAYLLRQDHLDVFELALHAAGPPGAREVAEIERFAAWVWCRPRVRAKVRASDPACGPDGGRGHELQLPSHLHGFAHTIDVAAGWVERKLSPWSCDAWSARPRTTVEDAFWNEFLLNTRFTFGGETGPRPGADRIRVFHDRPAERLVVAKTAIRRLRIRADASERAVALSPAVTTLWERACPGELPGTTMRDPPRSFRSILLTDPAFAARTFAFSPRESIELLRLHRMRGTRIALPAPAEREPAELALVLPGGGVKAAYQATLIERLYREGLLRSARADARADERGGPLDVDYVVGTSGGALLGFFAARMQIRAQRQP